MDILTAAVNYVEKYRWSVIPLKPGLKEPLIPWQEYQTRLPTMEELTRWFQSTQNGIGIVTGRISNLSVIDVDALEVLTSLTISSPIAVKTRKGKHFYFLYQEGLANSASKIAEHVDVRGEGGYVVAPPSLVDGHRYRFCSPIVRPSLLNVFPRELLTNAESRNVQPKAPDWISEALTKLSEGSRNETFTRVAGAMHRARFPASAMYTFLAPHAERVNFDREELNAVIQSVTKYENGQEESNALYTGNDKAENLADFLKGEEKVDWIVPGLISKSGIGFCAGLPESLKTWILIDLAIECARGGIWLGHTVHKAKVMFIDQERFKGETRRRVQKLLKGKQITLNENLSEHFIIQVGSSIRLNLDVSFDAFRKKLSDIRPDLVIVDSFATFSTVAENDRQEVQKVMERIKQLRQEFGCTFIFIDHEGKGVLSPDNIGRAPDAYSMIGSVGKPAAAELVLTVRKESDSSVVIYNTKNSLAPAINPISVQLVDTPNEGVKLEKL